MDDLNWFKSSRSTEAYCVEVAKTPDVVLCRDSKDPDGPRLTFPPDAFAAFLGGVQRGDFS